MSVTMNRSVLVVDPDQRRAATVAGLLGEGMEARQAGTAEEALVVANELAHLDAVVIHRDLPSSDGLDAVERLSESSELEAVPRILTASEAADLGACDGDCRAYIVESDPTARAELTLVTIALLRAAESAA